VDRYTGKWGTYWTIWVYVVKLIKREEDDKPKVPWPKVMVLAAKLLFVRRSEGTVYG
jgi:hypothetical protein